MIGLSLVTRLFTPRPRTEVMSGRHLTVRARRRRGHPFRPTANGEIATAAPLIILERIDPLLFGSAELDVLEQYFGDIVARVLGR